MARKLLALAAVALATTACGSAAHPNAAPTVEAKPRLARLGSLPQAISKAAAVALPGGRLMILGGYTGSASVDTILAGPPAHLRVAGHLPQPTHDAAAAYVGGSVYLYGGGSSVSEPTVVRVSPAGKTSNAPPLGEPLSDLGAVTIGSHAYLVGGYTGTEFATAILRDGTRVVARLPHGTRYAGVAAIGPVIYVVGGLTTAGATRSIYAVSPVGGVKLVGRLPRPEDHAALAALGGTLYYVGGRKVLAIDPKNGKVTVAARLPAPLSDPTATTVGTEIVIAGGGTSEVWALRP